MKTIIMYATKHGAAEEIARRIAYHIDGSVVCNLKKGSIPSLAEYGCVIIGSSIYAGTIRKEAKTFLSKNKSALQGKKLGLFLCGLEPSREKAIFDANFPPDIVQSAIAARFLGGIFDPQKAGAMDRLIMKMAAKQSAYTDTIDDNKIEQFAREMKK